MKTKITITALIYSIGFTAFGVGEAPGTNAGSLNTANTIPGTPNTVGTTNVNPFVTGSNMMTLPKNNVNQGPATTPNNGGPSQLNQNRQMQPNNSPFPAPSAVDIRFPGASPLPSYMQ